MYRTQCNFIFRLNFSAGCAKFALSSRKFWLQDGSRPNQDREVGRQGHHREVLHQVNLELRYQQAHHRGGGSYSHQVSQEQDRRIYHSFGMTCFVNLFVIAFSLLKLVD